MPSIGFGKRVEMRSIGDDCRQLTLRYGVENDPDVPTPPRLLAGRGSPLDGTDTSYILSRESALPALGGRMALRREKLFAALHRNADGAADSLSLPANRVVEIGTKVAY